MTFKTETFIALYDKLEAIMPEDGIIDDTCSLINEIIALVEEFSPSRPKAEAADDA